MSQSPASRPGSRAHLLGEVIFPTLAGLWLGLTLLKFGTPVILESRIESPGSALEAIFMPWPVKWGYVFLAVVGLSSLAVWRWPRTPPTGLLLLPAAWFLWQVIVSIQSVNPGLTGQTLSHFAACIASFYLALVALAAVRRLRLFWFWLLTGFLVVLAVGWHQRWGGLEETRRFFYELPNWRDYPAEFIQKLSSDRIYSTLFYPNTFAGVILLLLPVLVAAAWRATPSPGIRIALALATGFAGLACLYWSGSKAGWLLMLAMGVAAFVHLSVPTKTKLAVAGFVLALGLIGFVARYAGYFSRGATSVTARWDYWTVGWQLISEKPLTGSGPGTFLEGYRRLKAPDAEMSKLAHNDYLQQGTDSGLPGLLLYAAFWGWAVAWLYGRCRAEVLPFAVWLGVAGLAAQSLVEFGLYIPATAWLQFFLVGWLLGSRSNPIDTPNLSR